MGRKNEEVGAMPTWYWLTFMCCQPCLPTFQCFQSCVSWTLLHSLLLCLSCHSLRSVSFSGLILGLIKSAYHGWLSMKTSTESPFFGLPSGPPNPKPTTDYRDAVVVCRMPGPTLHGTTGSLLVTTKPLVDLIFAFHWKIAQNLVHGHTFGGTIAVHMAWGTSWPLITNKCLWNGLIGAESSSEPSKQSMFWSQTCFAEIMSSSSKHKKHWNSPSSKHISEPSAQTSDRKDFSTAKHRCFFLTFLNIRNQNFAVVRPSHLHIAPLCRYNEHCRWRVRSHIERSLPDIYHTEIKCRSIWLISADDGKIDCSCGRLWCFYLIFTEKTYNFHLLNID